MLILPRRRCCWLGDPWTLGLLEKGEGALCPGGTQKGKETGGIQMEASYVCCAIVVLLLLLPQLPSLIMATSDLVVWALLNPLCIMPCHLI